MFHKILIANRGEIACRVIATAKKMGIQTVAVYSTEDANSLHVSMADSAFCVGGPKASESYLNIDAIIKVAKECNVEGIHPGYGFLSESSAFAKKCAQNNITFIGPSVLAMEAMASKQLAKQMLEKTNVPLTPGYHGGDQSDDRLLQEAKKIGFPVLLKAANGGGGKGMRAVENIKKFNDELASARREAMASFADDTMLIEKLIIEPRHIEVQILADNFGTTLHLFERDCSIQRRHQKIIEEAPASNLDAKLKENLAAAAIEVAKTIDYRGAGTIEFLVDSAKNFYFMEMNTRLQVEHPVTEMITGLDLVEQQLRIGANEKLRIKQQDIKSFGHAIECRIYAEDPGNNFMPSIGKITYLHQPKQKNLRIDTGITQNSVVSRYYDPMLAKIIAWGETREQALCRLSYALNNYKLSGIKNNVSFLQAVLKNQSFVENKITTNFLNQEQIVIPKPDLHAGAYYAASLDYLIMKKINLDPLNQETFAFQMHLNSHWNRNYLINGIQLNTKITPKSLYELEIEVTDPNGDNLSQIKATIQIDDSTNTLIFNNGLEVKSVSFQKNHTNTVFYTDNGSVEVEPFYWQAIKDGPTNLDNQLTAPMPGTIVAILKKAKDSIKIGDPLIVMEAMKMEHTIIAPSDGVISSVFYDIGSQVPEGATLVAMEKE
ncbi:MAG: acetyl-CoA carboxylase biotin carboxylase subunit [Legionellaceae bacterium]|nr:acetyl-CoA carboxylase biotin carboxylase subunit [Legionellaceae bacterium]